MEENLEELCLFKRTFCEKLVSWTIKAIAYGPGSISLWPHFICNGFNPNKCGFELQSGSYQENGSTIYCTKKEFLKITTGNKEIRTINNVLFTSAERFPLRHCLGYRPVVSKTEEYCPDSKKTEIKYHLGEFVWKTYKDVQQDVLFISQEFIDMGFDETHKMALFCNTSPNWLTVAFALSNISSPIVTVYPTLSEDAVLHALILTEIRGIMVDEKTFPRICPFLNQFPHLKHVILSKHLEDVSVTDSLPSHISVTKFNDLLMTKSKTEPCMLSKQPKNIDDVVLIMFTSGSAGIPKGVVITHGNILSTLRSVALIKEFSDGKNLKHQDVFGAFLPSSHVFEFTFEIGMVSLGSAIGYCTPTTLFDTSPMIKAGTKGDLAELKPTILIAVPLLMERLRATVLEKVKETSRLKRLIFQTCYNIKMQYRRLGFNTPIIDRLVFKAIRANFGGKIRAGFIGGAYISRNVEEFANICFGNFKQGYGLTETTDGIILTRSEYLRTGSTGSPLPHCEIKLLPWEEGNFDPNDKIRPAGEIAVSGECVSLGYYKNEELTNSAFTVDKKTGKRWFHTGDIGLITADKCIRIIDRKSDIIKLAHGEYISLVKIESKVASCPLIDMNCVLPISSMEYLIALIIPNRPRVKEYLKNHSVDVDKKSMDELLDDPSIQSKLSDKIMEHISADLSKFEKPRKIYILADIWTPEKNLITPTVKLKRREIARYYQYLTK
ncbi:hypothetical protein HZS_7902 [Henneguya salminicola]|nr:hypothetical protein HZS_7902 [Henneguya salminicola]